MRGALDELLACARRHGLELAGVHYEERVSERLSTWCRLIADCRNEEIVHVVAPSREHFHKQASVADFMRDELASAIHGTVWIARARAHTATGETDLRHAK